MADRGDPNGRPAERRGLVSKTVLSNGSWRKCVDIGVFRVVRGLKLPSPHSAFRIPHSAIKTLIVGLGNPGPRYTGNRHNVGFQCIDLLAAKHHITLSRKLGYSIVGEGEIAGRSVVLAQPQTFMNASGKAVAALLRKYGRTPADLIVIHDELDLPLGRIRIRERGSAGGQRGVKSVIENLGTQEFVRVRVGIGRPGDAEPRDAVLQPVDYVLRNFLPAEKPVIEEARHTVVEAVEAILTDGTAAAMNQFNR